MIFLQRLRICQRRRRFKAPLMPWVTQHINTLIIGFPAGTNKFVNFMADDHIAGYS